MSLMKFLRNFSKTDNTGIIVAKNSEVFAVGDPVTIVAGSGILKVAAAGERIFGYADQAFTAAADNQTVAMLKPAVVRELGQVMRYEASAAFTIAAVGSFCKLTGTTGAIKMDQTTISATIGQFLVVGFGVDENGVNYVDVEAALPYKAFTVAA